MRDPGMNGVIKTSRDIIIDSLYRWGLHRIFKYDRSKLGYILAFHRIMSASKKRILDSNRLLEVTTQRFEQIIDFFISHNYEFISIDQLYMQLLNKINRNRFVLLTFDDGYKDTYDNAFPILQQYNIPFTLYLTTSYPNNTFLHWRLLLDDYIQTTEVIEILHQSRVMRYRTFTQMEKVFACDQIVQMVQTSSPDSRVDLLTSVFHLSIDDIAAYSRSISISWEEILKMSETTLVTIGAHSVNHPQFSRISTDQMRFEILQSIKEIETRLHRKVEHFAYPYGGTTEIGSRECETAKGCHLKTSVTTCPRYVSAECSEKLECLPRVVVSEQTNLQKLDLKLRL